MSEVRPGRKIFGSSPGRTDLAAFGPYVLTSCVFPTAHLIRELSFFPIGIIGSGKQYFPWIHIDDMTGMIVHALENDHVTGVLNGVAPEIVTNERFTKEYAGALWRPAILPAPAFVINFIFGQERGKLLLEGQKVIPKRTLELGYKFQFPEIKSALANIVK